ncbi:MAG: RDD family protein [Bdellovibrionaceae bacterium]|nr:RDD family protein [Pseudobdellovibrionaceae bacterium]
MIAAPSTGRRFIAKLLDTAIIEMIRLPVTLPLLFSFLNTGGIVLHINQFIFWFLVPICYEFLGVWLMRATPGKWIMGFKVMQKGRTSVDWSSSLLRATVNRFSLFFAGANYVLALTNRQRTHIADWIARTYLMEEGGRLRPSSPRWGAVFFLGPVLATLGLLVAMSVLTVVELRGFVLVVEMFA